VLTREEAPVIMLTPPVEFSEFTSTHFYRDWLKAEIANAEKIRPATTSGAP
jgi:hypothetical protein